MAHSEHQANQALGDYASERAKWAKVLARPAVRKAPAKKSFWQKLFNI